MWKGLVVGSRRYAGVVGGGSAPASRTVALHVLELVDASLGVALADLAQSLVFVTSLADVLAVDLVHRGLLGFVAGPRQVLLQRLRRRER